ncbi:hypothetical protein DIURU_001551 [Diutina rugosa]|uniref:Conserved oligomeric Golgi complex subunit 8 n=1 Tax=Diutina rugosa TaxID=5481 RepID=A0A642UTG3_DIURU|nr:uncharacterized protein DIURU_001551 [Diutina rugosa]KAA8905123.1 hypothetical protein DIURU_001551 [Diutina rugosa]
MSLLLQTLGGTNLTPDEAKECQAYLEELLVNDGLMCTDNFTTTSAASGTKTLVEEIAELDQQQRQINDKLGELTSNHRDVLIQLETDVTTVAENLTIKYPEELTQIPKLQIGSTNIDKLMSQVKTSSSVIQHIDSILDLLELPSLARLCITQGNYHEALEISVLVRSYCIRFPQIEAFKLIQAQVDAELQHMVKGLIRLLSTNVKAHSLGKIFQILTKLDIGTSESLQLLFLQGRYRFILQELASLKPLLKLSNKMTYLKRSVEVFREHGYATLYSYQSLFPSATNPLLVSQFCHQLADTLTEILVGNLAETKAYPENDGSIDGLLLQLVYLTKSLSKFGANFEVLLKERLSEWVTPEDWVRNIKKTSS